MSSQLDKQQNGSVGLRTRRALNSLQYSPNGRDIVGLSPRKSNNTAVQSKLGFEDSKPAPFVKMSRRTSISLPDFHADGSLKPLKSTAVTVTSSTPLRGAKGAVAGGKGSPSKLKLRMKNEISIIAEEKENPNYSLLSSSTVNLAEKPAVKSTTYSEMAVQCDKLNEDIVTSDVVPPVYWKMLAHKRYSALRETKRENVDLNSLIDELNDKNEATRMRIKELEDNLERFEEIKAQALKMAEEELEDEDSDDDEDDEKEDSGYEDPNENSSERKKFKQ